MSALYVLAYLAAGCVVAGIAQQKDPCDDVSLVCALAIFWPVIAVSYVAFKLGTACVWLGRQLGKVLP